MRHRFRSYRNRYKKFSSQYDLLLEAQQPCPPSRNEPDRFPSGWVTSACAAGWIGRGVRLSSACFAADWIICWEMPGGSNSAQNRPHACFVTTVMMPGINPAASAHADWSPEIRMTGLSKCPQTAAFNPISPVGSPWRVRLATRSSDQVCSRMAF